MKRKTKRQGGRKLVAFLTPLAAIIALVTLFYNSNKESLILPFIKSLQTRLSLEDGNSFPSLIVFTLSVVIIVLIAFSASRVYLNYHKPNKKYFDLIDFEKPTVDVLKRGLEGILNSEKTQPSFVHVAPINSEIEQFYKTLDTKNFVWENGRPGDGKTMLAYHALYRYRKKFKFTYRGIPIVFRTTKYKIYRLNLNHVTDQKEINEILGELDVLRGGNRKIVLVDDANKIHFEDKLRFEFEEEAKEQLNGKFVWINTNYLENKKSEESDSISIEFENFYPILVKTLYGSQNPTIKEAIKDKCSGLKDAIKLKEQGRIRDPWHFNFVASRGEQRSIQMLEKLSGKKEEQDTLLLSLFLFSVRNIITGEKEINQIEFTTLLTSISIPYFKKGIETYGAYNIISDLATQDKGRFLIIENKNSLNRGYLRATHYRMSTAIIRATVTYFSDSMEQMIEASNLLFKDDLRDTKFFYVYFNLLGTHQEYFLNKKKTWLRNFLTDLILEQLHVYPLILKELKKKHISFYEELISHEYCSNISSRISCAGANRFSAIQSFISVLGNDKEKLVNKLNWATLAHSTVDANVTQLKQVADLIIALGTDSEKFLNEFKDSDWQSLAFTATTAEVGQLKQVADFIIALKKDSEKILKKFKDSDWRILANKVSKAEVAQFGQLEGFLSALGNEKGKLLETLIDSDWRSLGFKATTAEVGQLNQVADFINALEKDSEKIIKEFKDSDWKVLANKASNAEVGQLNQVAHFINALGNERTKFSQHLKTETILNYTASLDIGKINSFCIIIASLEEERQNQVVPKVDWISILNLVVINHSVTINQLSYVLSYHIAKCKLQGKVGADTYVTTYLENKKSEIVHFSTQFFQSPVDFNDSAKFLTALFVCHDQLANEVAKKITLSIIKTFKINPQHYKSFSKLLSIIHQINPKMGNSIIANIFVWKQLCDSIKSDDSKNQLEGLESLKKIIQTIDAVRYERIK